MIEAEEEGEPELRRQLRAARVAERQNKMDAALAEKQAKVRGGGVGRELVLPGLMALMNEEHEHEHLI